MNANQRTEPDNLSSHSETGDASQDEEASESVTAGEVTGAVAEQVGCLYLLFRIPILCGVFGGIAGGSIGYTFGESLGGVIVGILIGAVGVAVGALLGLVIYLGFRFGFDF